MKHLSTDTIIQSLKYLNKDEMGNPSIFFTFLVMKRMKITKNSYISSDVLKKGLEYVFTLGSIYSTKEKAPNTNNFIYPFANQYLDGSPNEHIVKWSGGRLKNNVLGGATTWRLLVNEDNENNELRFSHRYVKELKKLCIKEHKVNILALAIWSSRFNEFETEWHADKFVKKFRSLFDIDDEEFNELFFVDNQDIDIVYSDTEADFYEIRKFIDTKSNMDEDWYKVEPVNKDQQILEKGTIVMDTNNTSTNNLNEEQILDLFEISPQIILSGPPGTSKSFMAKKIGEKFDEVFHIQFHPQTTYNEFIGGYKVNGSNVEYEDGVLLKFIDEIKEDKNYLLIIDEINRTNISQVFGEVIQCLDRDYQVNLTVEKNKSIDFSLPKNLFIIGTQNSSDRTLGNMDFALKRRFLRVDMYADADLLLDACSSENNMNSILSNLLNRINTNLFNSTKNIDFQIGHALFLDTNDLDDDGKVVWNYSKLEKTFNYKVLPLIIDFCYNNMSLANEVLGVLTKRLKNEDFIEAIEDYIK